jgi:type IV pilus assembly protein PilM
VALINIGANLTSLIIISNGISAFTREIANGGHTISEQVQKQLGIPYDLAEAYKCGTADQPAPPQVTQIVESAADGIAAEIQRSLDFFMATSGDGDISRIYITGGTSKIASLSQAIERRARVPVEVWAPTEKLSIDNKRIDTSLLGVHAPQLAVALGLALRKEKEVRA